VEDTCVDIIREFRTRKIISNPSGIQTSVKVQICDSDTRNTYKKSNFHHIAFIGLENILILLLFTNSFAFFPFNNSEAVISIHI